MIINDVSHDSSSYAALMVMNPIESVILGSQSVRPPMNPGDDQKSNNSHQDDIANEAGIGDSDDNNDVANGGGGGATG